MKDKLLSFLVLPSIMFALFLAFSPVGRVEAIDHKTDICHSTSAIANPYTTNNVDKNSTVGGHGDDTGPVWNSTMANGDKWGDIIPPYDYYEEEVIDTVLGCPKTYTASTITCPGKCQKNAQPEDASKCVEKEWIDVYGDVKYTFPGLNWSAGAKIVLEDLNCTIPNKCVYKSDIIEYSLWSDWMTDEETSKLYRLRTTYQYDKVYKDLYNETIPCNSEERYDACDKTEIKDPTFSSWVTDPNDATKEIQTVTTLTVDSTDETVICDTDIDTMSRNIETEGEDDDEDDDDNSDDEDVRGATDDTTKDTGVVLAATGPTDNIVVYIVELLLVAMLVTYSVFFTKTYLKNSK